MIGLVLIFQMLVMIIFVSFRSTIKNRFLPTLRLSILEKYQGPLEENLSSVSLLWDWIMYHVSSEILRREIYIDRLNSSVEMLWDGK